MKKLNRLMDTYLQMRMVLLLAGDVPAGDLTGKVKYVFFSSNYILFLDEKYLPLIFPEQVYLSR